MAFLTTAEMEAWKARQRWPGFKRELAIHRLLTHYGSNRDFLIDFSELITFDTRPSGLADKWGLKAPWAVPLIVREAAATVDALEKWDKKRDEKWEPIFPLLPMQVSHSPEDGLEDWRERELAHPLSGSPPRLSFTTLERNIGWLYQRIALKDTPLRISVRDEVGLDVVEEGIRKLARLLDLTLPHTH